MLRDSEEVLWLFDYYSHLEDYVRGQYFFDPDYDKFLLLERDVPYAYYAMLNDTLYRGALYREEFGRLPTLTELADYNPVLKDYGTAADYEEYKKYSHIYHGSPSFVLCDEDYCLLSTAYGESDELVDPSGADEKYDSYYSAIYAVIHSFDPEKTEEYLTAYVDMSEEDPKPLITPNSIFERLYASEKLAVVSGIVTMGVILGVMSVCMYFIMRSALMNRIREIGILRAIGVSRKNLVFLFAVETAVLVSLTVFVGYLLSSGFIGLCLSASGLVSEIFYYPVWLALAVLLVLVLIAAFCGLVPILLLTKKTPSAILSKYDI